MIICLAACTAGLSNTENISLNGEQQTEDGGAETAVSATETERPDGWTEASHSNDVAPNYDIVFPQDEVNQITITIAPEEWEAMQANMVELFGEAGSGNNRGGGFPGGFEPPQDGNLPQPGEGIPDTGGELPQFEAGERPEPGGGGFGGPGGERGGGFGAGDLTPENPMWVTATIAFEGQTWTNVGVRYKGNSSLTSGWNEGTLKLPFKLDFDEFEDDYPEIDNQRFYGFKQLSLANGFSDSSFLRDAVTYDILEEAGLPAAETAFYEVILDYGEGSQSLGLYTMVEVIDDTVIDGYFGNDDGNIYEADGDAASFAESTVTQIEESFQKENNEDDADWSDIETLFEVLHSDQRTTDPDAWRQSLEAIFEVDSFLEWLAISAIIQHWDTYGAMSHNYYLYNDPDTGQLTWISWDHNMAMSSGFGEGGRGGGGNRSTSLDKEDVNENWPLIRYLMDDPVYYSAYIGYMESAMDGPLDPDKLAAKYEAMADLIAPYAAEDVGEDVFETAVRQLIDFAYERTEAVEAFLSE